MIKLASKNSLPSAMAVLEIKSASDVASISLTVEEVRMPDSAGNFAVSKERLKQVVSFVGADGTACSLEGVIPEETAIVLDQAAFKVVVEIEIQNELKAAYQAGRVSKSYTSLVLVRVVEVWEDAKKCLYRAKDGASHAASADPVMSADGKIVRSA